MIYRIDMVQKDGMEWVGLGKVARMAEWQSGRVGKCKSAVLLRTISKFVRNDERKN